VQGLIVHEWIEKNGGAEKVLEKLADLVPAADVLCLWNDPGHLVSGRKVKESVLARTPLRRSKAAALLTMPVVWRTIKLNSYDWAVISTHLFAHHVKVDTRTTHPEKYAYVHTPARYIWTPELDDRGRSLPARLISKPLRRIDAIRARELKSIAANSEFVRQRIASTWERDATVIYPPVAVNRITSVPDWRDHLSSIEHDTMDGLPEHFVLGASRLVKYKMLDQVIRVGKRAGLPVVIVGDGPDKLRLERIAQDEKVECYFLGGITDEMLYSLYRQCSFYVFPPIEDFGIVPVEAMAAGAAVIANRVGGASETVLHGVTGALTDFSSDNEIDEAIRVVQSCHSTASTQQAENFSEERFRRSLTDWAPHIFGSYVAVKEKDA
jgi:glycosyltransferase involved in cell wall biosynthesis